MRSSTSINDSFEESDDSIGIIPNFNFSDESCIFDPKRDDIIQQLQPVEGKPQNDSRNGDKKETSINVNAIDTQRVTDLSENEREAKQKLPYSKHCKNINLNYDSGVCKSPISSSLIKSRRINIHRKDNEFTQATRNFERTLTKVLGARTLETYSIFSTYTYPVLFPLAFILQATLLYAFFNAIKGVLPYGQYKRILWISMYLASAYIFVQGLSSFLAKCYGTKTNKDRPARCIRGCVSTIGSSLVLYMAGCVAQEAMFINGHHKLDSNQQFNISDIGSIGLLLIVGSVYYLWKKSNENSSKK